MHSLPLSTCFLLFCIIALTPSALCAQVKYGTVTYTASPSFTITQPSEDVPTTDKLEKMLRDLHASGGFDKYYSLTFTPDAFQFRQHEIKDQTLQDGAMTVAVLRNQTAPEIFYTDTRSGTYTNQEPIADQLFLHGDSISTVPWTLAETTIPASDATLGFMLKTATAVTATGDSLTAAYAPALPLNFGPMNYYGLPGAILQLDVCRRGSCTRYRATELALRTEEPTLAPPTEGKRVSSDRYYALLEKYRARKPRTTRQIIRQ